MSCLLYFFRSSNAITSTLYNVYTTAIHWVAFLPILTSSALSLLNVQCASTQTMSTMCEYTHAHTLHPPPLHQSVSMLLLKHESAISFNLPILHTSSLPESTLVLHLRIEVRMLSSVMQAGDVCYHYPPLQLMARCIYHDITQAFICNCQRQNNVNMDLF